VSGGRSKEWAWEVGQNTAETPGGSGEREWRERTQIQSSLGHDDREPPLASSFMFGAVGSSRVAMQWRRAADSSTGIDRLAAVRLSHRAGERAARRPYCALP
jgi:hypothetical protein